MPASEATESCLADALPTCSQLYNVSLIVSLNINLKDSGHRQVRSKVCSRSNKTRRFRYN